MKIFELINDAILKFNRRRRMSIAKKTARMSAKETGRLHYVIDGPDGKPLVLSSRVAKILKKRKLMSKGVFLINDALYIAR